MERVDEKVVAAVGVERRKRRGMAKRQAGRGGGREAATMKGLRERERIMQ